MPAPLSSEPKRDGDVKGERPLTIGAIAGTLVFVSIAVWLFFRHDPVADLVMGIPDAIYSKYSKPVPHGGLGTDFGVAIPVYLGFLLLFPGLVGCIVGVFVARTLRRRARSVPSPIRTDPPSKEHEAGGH